MSESETFTVEDADRFDLDEEHFPLDRFQPLKQIGEGTAGSVYLCFDKKLDKQVAVKILKSASPDHLITFQNEAKITARLHHPNIIQILDFGATAGGSPYMVMEYVEGSNIKQMVERHGPLDPWLAVTLFMQVCEALSHAHRIGTFHRDLQSSNMMVRSDDKGEPQVEILDFGLAKFKSETLTPHNFGGRTIVGTPLYMSPDQVNGKEFDSRSEVYSVGCVLFEALTGQPPFQGATALETMGMHAHKAPPSVLRVLKKDKFGLALDQIVSACLAKDPDDRFQSMDELKNELEDTLAIEPETATEDNEKPVLQSNRRPKIKGVFLFLVILIPVIGIATFTVSHIVRGSPPDDGMKVDLLPSIKSLGMEYDGAPRIYEKSGERIASFGYNSTDKDLMQILPEAPKITSLIVTETDEVTLNGLTKLAPALHLRCLQLKQVNFSKQDFMKALELFKDLKDIDLSKNRVVDEDVLRKIVREHPNLIRLVISGCDVDHGFLKILYGLKQLHRLCITDIDLSRSDLQMLERMPVSHLTVSYDRVNADDLIAALKRNSEVKLLDIRKWNRSTPKEIETLRRIRTALPDKKVGWE